MVQGAVEGDLAGPSLTVSATGAVSGKVEAGELTTAGRIAGEFDVDAATIAGTVEHNTVVRAASLDLKLEVTRGKVQLSFGGSAPAGGSSAMGRDSRASDGTSTKRSSMVAAPTLCSMAPRSAWVRGK